MSTAHSLLALPASGMEVALGSPSFAAKVGVGWNGGLAATLAGALTATGLARLRMQFPWTWMARLEDLPLPTPMISSLTAGGVVYAIQLAEMLGRDVPLSPRVRRDLESCCRQLGIAPGEKAPAWWTENLDTLEAAFREPVRRKVLEYVAQQLPLGAPLAAPLAASPWTAEEPVKATAPEPQWNALSVGLVVPAMHRPVIALEPPTSLEPLARFSAVDAETIELSMAYSIGLTVEDRVWLWQADEAEPTCYRISWAEEMVWWVEGVAGAQRIVAASLERSGVCLGSAVRSPADIAEVILAAEGWERTAAWLRWCRVPVFEGLVKRAVARRVKAEPEATLAAWLAPDGPDGLTGAPEPVTAELMLEFFTNWWASAEEADAMIRAASLQGLDPEAWVRLASAHPVLLGQLLAAGWQDRPATERKALLRAVCDRLAKWIVVDGRGGEAHWELAEQAALTKAAADWGVAEWLFKSSGQARALTDWVQGRPVPPEMRHRWVGAWASPATRQWTALRVVRQILGEIASPRARGAVA
jgi:hypothetical protein